MNPSRALVVFLTILAVCMALFWFAWRDFNGQQHDNRLQLVDAATEHARHFDQQLITPWAEERKRRIPANFIDCLQTSEVAVKGGRPLWPVGNLASVEQLREWTLETGEGIRMKPERLKEFEKLVSVDPYLLDVWTATTGGDPKITGELLEAALMEAGKAESRGSDLLDVTGGFWTFHQDIEGHGEVWRAVRIPVPTLLTGNRHFIMATSGAGKDVLHATKILGTTVNWVLTEEGGRFLGQQGSRQGLYLSGAITGIVLIYGFIFFVRSQGHLQRQARLREQLVSDISHELRTPVTTLQMYAEMLRDGRVPEARKADYFGNMARESKRLGRLIDNILDFTRLNRRGLSLHLRPIGGVELEGLLADAIEPLDQGGRVRRKIPADLSINADPEAVVQVVYNLVANALKYAPEGPVDLEASMTADSTVLSVRDRGPGIPSDEVPHLFEPFFRGRRAHEAQIQGSGLGLGISQALMQAMGGSLEFRPGGPGAHFAALFPKSPGGSS
ncbi:MAG: sensor histidine kinase [Planctomycetota bacterium]